MRPTRAWGVRSRYNVKSLTVSMSEKKPIACFRTERDKPHHRPAVSAYHQLPVPWQQPSPYPAHRRGARWYSNVFTPDLQVHQLVLFVAEKTNNTLQSTLASFGIFSPYQLIRLDFFNRNQTIYGTDRSSCQHHTILALLLSTRPMPSPGGRAAVSSAK